MPAFCRPFASADVGVHGADAHADGSAGRRRFVGASGRWRPLIPLPPEVPIGSNHPARFGRGTPLILPSPRRTPLFSLPSARRRVASDATSLWRARLELGVQLEVNAEYLLLFDHKAILLDLLDLNGIFFI